jgi:acyl-CoA thioester hydrolase
VLELYPPGGEAVWLRSFRFALELRPRFAETDALGHVSNVIYPTYWELARLRYFGAVGEADDAPPRAFPFNHVAAEITTRMLQPCFYDDELLIHARVVALGRSSMTIENALSHAENGEIRALARVAIVASDGERVIPWTPGQRAKIEAFEGRSF